MLYYKCVVPLTHHFPVIVASQISREEKIVPLQEAVRDLIVKLNVMQLNGGSRVKSFAFVVAAPANIKNNGTPDFQRQSHTRKV